MYFQPQKKQIMKWILEYGELIGFLLVFPFGLYLWILAGKASIANESTKEVKTQSSQLKIPAAMLMLLGLASLIKFLIS